MVGALWEIFAVNVTMYLAVYSGRVLWVFFDSRLDYYTTMPKNVHAHDVTHSVPVLDSGNLVTLT